MHGSPSPRPCHAARSRSIHQGAVQYLDSRFRGNDGLGEGFAWGVPNISISCQKWDKPGALLRQKIPHTEKARARRARRYFIGQRCANGVDFQLNLHAQPCQRVIRIQHRVVWV